MNGGLRTELDEFGSVLESVGWVRYTWAPLHLSGVEHGSWTHRTLPLRLWSVADTTGIREHALAARAPSGPGWAWRVNMPDGPGARSAMFVLGAAEASAQDGYGPDTGSVFTALTDLGWTLTCGTDPDEPSYGAAGPGGTGIVHLPDSPVDPGMWLVTFPDGEQATASSAAPWTVVVALASV